MEELKFCPCCGGAARYKSKPPVVIKGLATWNFTIACSECSLKLGRGYHVSVVFNPLAECATEIVADERPDAVADWNRRATEEPDNQEESTGDESNGE